MGRIFLQVPSSGKNEEGFGAIMQDVLAYYATSRVLGIRTLFNGLRDLQHYQYYNVTQEEFCQDLNSLFDCMISELSEKDVQYIKFQNIDQSTFDFIKNFDKEKDDVVLNIDHGSVINFFRSNIQMMEKIDVFKEVRENLFIPESEKYFKRGAINVAIHIRKFTETDVDLNSSREYYSKEKVQYYINLIEKIGNIIGNEREKEFHIYSQGKEEDFQFLTRCNQRVKLHIEEYPPTTMYHLCKSDILVMANSSFSYVSGLIGNQILLCRNNFWHPTFSERKITLDGSEIFNEHDFRLKLNNYMV